MELRLSSFAFSQQIIVAQLQGCGIMLLQKESEGVKILPSSKSSNQYSSNVCGMRFQVGRRSKPASLMHSCLLISSALEPMLSTILRRHDYLLRSCAWYVTMQTARYPPTACKA